MALFIWRWRIISWPVCWGKTKIIARYFTEIRGTATRRKTKICGYFFNNLSDFVTTGLISNNENSAIIVRDASSIFRGISQIWQNDGKD